MKKGILLVMLAIMAMTGTLSANESRPVMAPGDDLVIELKIIFHRPKFDCERGFGICLLMSATWVDSGKPGSSEYCRAKAFVNERDQLVLEVTESALEKYESGSTLPFFKDRTSISIPDPYTLPDETCKALGIDPPKTIKAGTYPVRYTNGTYTVVFQL